VPRDTANGLFAGLTLGQFCDRVMAEVAEAKPGGGTYDFVDIGLALLIGTGLAGF
jgi:hypothetical protein